ncbi:lipooligosaccharide transport system permease protein [Allocatelliglobosispora scoriae]|uniref:Transport permease protein n=1 Tax=Allocatelliglobosispora scoriae TaxID=643052 RepID=A0A841BLV0_9ACTN|nr:ABC transporter permease [Allocatelliglobosispora scoriae]MBB5868338.1 lipooligosaccharide transport system permease protein [Allocatelliglobosispora scoriae]
MTAVTAHLLTYYRQTWRDSAFNSFILPLCLLIGIGWSVGRHVDQSLGVPYLSYVAPGLLAAAVTQVAAAESAWSVYGGFEWSRIYHAMRVTPARISDILMGHLGYVVLRSVIAGAGFLAVVAAFGVPRSWWALAVLPLAVLIALAVAAPVFAVSASIRHPGMFDVLFRLGIIPMSLLSGVYFPLATLPVPVRAAVLLLPLSHATELVRMCVLGDVRAGAAAVHILCLLAWAGFGFLLARAAFTRRLSD